MPKKNGEEAEVKNFEVEQMFLATLNIRDMHSLLLLEEMNLKDIFTKVKLRG